MKIVTVVGARPQFIKAAALSREIKKFVNVDEKIVHTGQHYDQNMSEVFFKEMSIPKPDYNLNINGLTHGAMTGQMLEKIEAVLLEEKPDWVLVYGDTNSTIAGALAAKKLHIKVAHVEAGLRSFNMKMPEEVNRIVTDRISDLLFCPTDRAIENLKQEGYNTLNVNILKSGDIMLDAALFYKDKMQPIKSISLDKPFVLVTCHRASNTDNSDRLRTIFKALDEIAKTHNVVLPLHPRTKNKLSQYNIPTSNISLINPVGYLSMIWLITNAQMVLTDSGGLQKEAYFFEKPCITMRDETEWVELVHHKFNTLVGADYDKIVQTYKTILSEEKKDYSLNLYGNGTTSKMILNSLGNY